MNQPIKVDKAIKNRGKGECKMWVITVFEKMNVRIFEYLDKDEALLALQQFGQNALLSYTN